MQHSILILLAGTIVAASPLPNSNAQVYRGDFPNYYLKSEQVASTSIHPYQKEKAHYVPLKMFMGHGNGEPANDNQAHKVLEMQMHDRARIGYFGDEDIDNSVQGQVYKIYPLYDDPNRNLQYKSVVGYIGEFPDFLGAQDDLSVVSQFMDTLGHQGTIAQRSANAGKSASIDEKQVYFMPGMNYITSHGLHTHAGQDFVKHKVSTHANPVGVYDSTPWGFFN